MPIATVNPATGELLQQFAAHSPEQVDQMLDRSVGAYQQLRAASFAQRAAWLRAAADLLDADLERAAALASTEMGKTIATARYEVAKSANAMRWYAEHAESFLTPQEPVPPASVNASAASVSFEPIGPILAVMPWNYPYWQVIRFASPALMAGNTCLLKHSSNVPQTALLIEEIFTKAGFPQGSFQTLLVESPDVARIVEDRRVRAVTLTGSTGAGAFCVPGTYGAGTQPSVVLLGTRVSVVTPKMFATATRSSALQVARPRMR